MQARTNGKESTAISFDDAVLDEPIFGPEWPNAAADESKEHSLTSAAGVNPGTA